MNEILVETNMTEKAKRLLQAMAACAPVSWRLTKRAHAGKLGAIMTYGAGQPNRKAVLDMLKARGTRLVLWDVGYFARREAKGYMRLSIDRMHPQHVLDLAPDDGSRWAQLGIALREDCDPKGPILLIGMGPKSRAITQGQNWEYETYQHLVKRYPDAKIIYRPKPNRPYTILPCATDATTPIEQLLQGASLVVTKHSNVGLDAAVAGVPVQCEDGAAKWLEGKPYTRENRLDLLQRVMWFNFRPDEPAAAWKMIERCLTT